MLALGPGNRTPGLAGDLGDAKAKDPIDRVRTYLDTAGTPPSAIVSITLSEPVSKAAKGTADPSKTPNPTPRDSRRYIPSGAFARAILLGGLDAPTGGQAQRNPQPVLLRLVDNAVLPNHFRSRIKECFVVGAGFGDIAASLPWS